MSEEMCLQDLLESPAEKIIQPATGHPTATHETYTAHMKVTLLILGAPYSTQASASALRFARTLLASGHDIYQLFFYNDGVHNASNLIIAAQDEINIPQHWCALIEEHQLDAVVCIAAATRRGILNRQEAQRHNKSAANLLEGHTLSGLGQLVDACLHSDRVVTFG